MQENSLDLIGPDWEGLLNNRVHPIGPVAMYQSWHQLLFLHARVPVEVLQSMVPEGLTVETYDGSAWLGFVPFRMADIHPRGLPTAGRLSNFCETNIRTYVTHPKHGPGVWFLSLEASRYLACTIARTWFSLPYFFARLNVAHQNDTYVYQGRRKPDQYLPKLDVTTANLDRYQVVAKRSSEWQAAQEGSFEFWLVERYRLYAMSRKAGLLTARVAHKPYEIAEATIHRLVIEGLEPQFGELKFEHFALAKSVNVECFSPTLAGE